MVADWPEGELSYARCTAAQPLAHHPAHPLLPTRLAVRVNGGIVQQGITLAIPGGRVVYPRFQARSVVGLWA